MKKSFKEYIVEAKFTKPIYAYHATKAEYLHSIIKNGLIPNKSENGYGSDESSSEFGYSLQSLPGVYFSRIAKNSINIAKSFSEPSIIVVCKIQPNQLDLDEDEVATVLVNERQLLRELVAIAKEQFNLDYEKFMESGKDEEFAKQYATNIIKTNEIINKQNQEFKKVAYDALYQYIFTLVDMFAAIGHIDETDAREQKNKLTKVMRRLFKQDTSYDNLKLDSAIGFSGSNKIVGMYSVDANIGWGDLGQLKGYSYHEYKTPVEFANKTMEFLSNR